MSLQDEAFYFLGNSYRHLYPERPRKTYRERLIEAGGLLPLQNRPTLRMMDTCFERASVHMTEYFRSLDTQRPMTDEPWKQDRRVMP